MVEPPVPPIVGAASTVSTGPADLLQVDAAAPPAHGAAPATFSTFLITDIEGSTRLWEEQPGVMGEALAQHDRLLRGAIEEHGGSVVKTLGDGVLAVFADPAAGVLAAIDAQRALRDAAWGPTGPLRARMAIHTGAAETRDADYFGQALNRDARILAIGHGGQVLLSTVTALLARDRLPADVELVDLGSHRLRDLDRSEQVFQVRAADLRGDFPPLRSLSTRRSNLPIPLTSFVGRNDEIAEVEGLVARTRLVTLVGTGGTGKTRLMLEVAGRIAARSTDGTWLIELAPLRDQAEIAPEIARTLGIPDVPGRTVLDAVTDFLAAKDLLLLLDNAEHLIAGVAAIAGHLLGRAPELRILTTSREALAVAGEVAFPVPSLGCPVFADRGAAAGPIEAAELRAAAGTEAVRLFSDRASAADPSFQVTPANVEAVTEICRRLDGIPLAIELAAARMSALSAEEIAARIGDRFRLLTGGRRTAVPRQQTLHALIDWSWDLLDETDRRTLRRLSAFSGGWTARAAAGIVGDVAPDALTPASLDDRAEVATLDALTRLVDRSLVVVDRGAATRYRMLETIRQYARERLMEAGEAAEIADRHFRWFGALAAAAAEGLEGSSMIDWLDRLDADAENLGAALEWGLDASPEAGILMCDALVEYWRVRSVAPGAAGRIDRSIDVARRLVAGPPAPTNAQLALAGHFLGRAAFLWAARGDGGKGIHLAEDALEIARSSGDDAAVLAALGGRIMVRAFSTEETDPRPMIEEALVLAQKLEDWFTIVGVAGLGGASIARFDPERGERWLGLAIEALRHTDNPMQLALMAVGLGRRLGAAGKVEEARSKFEEAAANLDQIGDVRLALMARSDLGHALRVAQHLDEAQSIYRAVLAGWLRLGNRGAVASVIENLAYVLIERGEGLGAARLLGAAEAIREAADAAMPTFEVDDHRSWLDRLNSTADATEIRVAWTAGRSTSIDEAIALAGSDGVGRS